MPDNIARDFALPGFKSSERAEPPADSIVRAFGLPGFRSSAATPSEVADAQKALVTPKPVAVKPVSRDAEIAARWEKETTKEVAKHFGLSTDEVIAAVRRHENASTPAAKPKPKVETPLGQKLARGVTAGFEVTRKGAGVVGAIAIDRVEFHTSRDPIGDLCRMLGTHGHAGTVTLRVDGAERRVALGDKAAIARLAAEWGGGGV